MIQLSGICMITPKKSGISFMCLTAGLCSHSVLSCLTWRTKAFFLFGILSLFLPIFISSLSVPSSSKALSSKTVGGLFLMLHLLFMVITCAWSLPGPCLPLCCPDPHLSHGLFGNSCCRAAMHVLFDPTEQTNT